MRFMDKIKLIKNSDYFDELWYRQNYDVPKKYKLNVAKHYLKIGWKKYYNPSKNFCTYYYLVLNPDVAKTGICPLLHYERYGKIENRIINDVYFRLIKHSDYFNEKFYREKFLKDENVDPAWHYMTVGWKKNFDPSPYFSSNLYLVYNPDVRKACMCPLLHFELHGKKELPCRRISGVYNISSNTTHDFYNRLFRNDEKLKQLSLAEKKKITQHNESIDIIICVHNALEDVKLCLNSILRCTQDPFRLILVDDNSDKTTHEFLESFVSQNKNTVLLNNNTENHGYGYSANIGLRYSTAKYIVLLNSDTIVTQKWIDKMVDCSNSDDNLV